MWGMASSEPPLQSIGFYMDADADAFALISDKLCTSGTRCRTVVEDRSHDLLFHTMWTTSTKGQARRSPRVAWFDDDDQRQCHQATDQARVKQRPRQTRRRYTVATRAACHVRERWDTQDKGPVSPASGRSETSRRNSR